MVESFEAEGEGCRERERSGPFISLVSSDGVHGRVVLPTLVLDVDCV